MFSPLGSHHNNLSHHTYPSPPSLHTIFLFCSFSVVPASSQEFSLAAGSTENHRLSPKTHKVPRQTRSAINYLKLKSPSAWRWKRPLRPSTATSERTDGGTGKASRSPCRGEERGTGGRRLILRDRGCWLMKHGRCLLRENILILLIERRVANTKGYADMLLIRRITGECCLFVEAQNTASVECTHMWRWTEEPALHSVRTVMLLLRIQNAGLKWDAEQWNKNQTKQINMQGQKMHFFF